MPVILYRDANYGGPSIRLQPGFYSGKDKLEGTTQGSSYGEDLSRAISSIRVDAGYIAVVYASLGATASGGGARAIVGPSEIPDMGAIGMDNKTSAVQVYMYEEARTALPRDFGVKLYNTTAQQSAGVHIGQGRYDRARLNSDEVKVGPGGVRGLCVGPNTLVIIYEGGALDAALNSVVISPQTCIGDIESELGMPTVNSVRVLYSEVSRSPTVLGAPHVPPGATAREQAIARAQEALGRPIIFEVQDLPAMSVSGALPAVPVSGALPAKPVSGAPPTLVLTLVLIILIAAALFRATRKKSCRHSGAQAAELAAPVRPNPPSTLAV